MVANLKLDIKEILFVYGIGIILTLISVLYFILVGYPVVSTVSETLNITAPPIYMNSVFLPYGILIGEIIWNWNQKKNWKISIILFVETAVVGIFSLIRYIISIPLSGHAIMLFFYIFHQAISNKTKFLLRFLIGIVVLIITVIYKLFIWNDPITFILGAIAGIVLWIPGFFYQIMKRK
ncbi:MAG: hypothetical protein ACFFB0_22475 [Promethearchaeota archaeon]